MASVGAITPTDTATVPTRPSWRRSPPLIGRPRSAGPRSGARGSRPLCSRGPSQQPQLPGAADSLVAGLGPQLGVDVARVGLDGVDRQEQLLADLALGERAGQQVQDGELAV